MSRLSIAPDEEALLRTLSNPLALLFGYVVNSNPQETGLALDKRLQTPAIERLMNRGLVAEAECVSSLVHAFTGSTTLRFVVLTDKGRELANTLG